MKDPIKDLLDHLDELLEAMDGMDCADYPMVPVLLEIVQQDISRVKEAS